VYDVFAGAHEFCADDEGAQLLQSQPSGQHATCFSTHRQVFLAGQQLSQELLAMVVSLAGLVHDLLVWLFEICAAHWVGSRALCLFCRRATVACVTVCWLPVPAGVACTDKCCYAEAEEHDAPHAAAS